MSDIAWMTTQFHRESGWAKGSHNNISTLKSMQRVALRPQMHQDTEHLTENSNYFNII